MAVVWKICIRPDPQRDDVARGFALANTMEEALALVAHPHAVALPCPGKRWPGPDGSRLHWPGKTVQSAA